MHMKSVLVEFSYICEINFKNYIINTLNRKLQDSEGKKKCSRKGKLKNLIVNSSQVKHNGRNLLSILELMTSLKLLL